MRLHRPHFHSNITKNQKMISIVIIILLFILVIFGFLSTRREITIYLDGEKINTTTKNFVTENALRNIDELKDVDLNTAQIKYDDNFLTGSTPVVQVNTLKNITVEEGGHKYDYATHSNTIKELVNEDVLVSKSLGPYDYNDFDKKIKDNDTLKLGHSEFKTTTDTESKINKKEVNDDSIYVGVKRVTTKGKPELTEVKYDVYYVDGKQMYKNVLETKVIQKGETQYVSVGTKPLDPNDVAIWDKLSYCEAGGRWDRDSGNGYYGALQINPGSWKSIAPTLGIEADLPSKATKEEQIAVGKVMQARSGWGQWPSCAKKLGLI